MITDKTLLKVTGVGAESCWGGSGTWFKPYSQKRPGKWMPLIKYIEPCERGYHVCEGEQVLQWLHDELYEVEIRGEQIREEDKIVAQQARLVRRITNWNERTARLFACDCAERVLHIFEEKYPDDKRPREAIEVARAYANDKATEKELIRAFDAAAADSVLYNVRGAAYYAVVAARLLASVYLTTEVARVAVCAAADAVTADAGAAVAVAAADADAGVCVHVNADLAKELKWQWNRLKQYLNGEIL